MAEKPTYKELTEWVKESEQEKIKRKQAEQWKALNIIILDTINKSKVWKDCIEKISDVIKQFTGFGAVGIRLRENEDFPYYVTKGFPAHFVEAERYLCTRDSKGEIIRDSEGNPYVECMCGNVLCGRTNASKDFFTEHGSFWSNNTSKLLSETTDEDRQTRTRNRCNSEGYESVGLFPLKIGHEILGLLQINDCRPHQFTNDKLQFFEGIGISIGLAFSRKLAKDSLQESEEKYRAIMESMKDNVYIASKEFRIEYMNPRMTSKIGYDAVGELCHKAIYDNDEKCSWCVADQIFQRKCVEYELEDPRDNRFYAVTSSPILHVNDNVSKLTILHDITVKKTIESQLLQTHKMEAVGSLAGGIAHQFNNALYTIIGNIDLLEMDLPGDEKVADYTKVMKDSAHRMTKLTAQLLAYAQGGKYQTKMVSLSDFIKETLPQVKQIIASAISVDTDLHRDVVNANVKIDLTQMQMVLSAVMTNASEAMKGKGHIQITCHSATITDETAEAFSELKPGKYVCLAIADNGKGMDEETRNRVFEPFFTTKFEGRGLGMAAAYGIVKNHYGWISVDSEIDQGTIVKIYIPVVEAHVIEEMKLSQPKPKWSKGTGTILVIEDEEAVIKVTRVILEKLGYRVIEAATGREAIKITKTFDDVIDLAMLDVLLSDMNGNEIYPYIKKARPGMKVLVFSGYSTDGPSQEILNAGAEDFIQKPFTMGDLSDKLKKILLVG